MCRVYEGDVVAGHAAVPGGAYVASSLPVGVGVGRGGREWWGWRGWLGCLHLVTRCRGLGQGWEGGGVLLCLVDGDLWTGLSFRGGGGKTFVTPTETNVHGDALCFMVMGTSLYQRLAIGG